MVDKFDFLIILKNAVKNNGFSSSHNFYYKESRDVVVIIQSQKSNFSNMYYVNYGFYVKAVHNDEKCVNIHACDIMGRFENGCTRNKDSFFLDNLSTEALSKNLQENMEHVIIPVINEGIAKYFELFPHAIYAAKPNLRKYIDNLEGQLLDL